jgi:hypothetical protein
MAAIAHLPTYSPREGSSPPDSAFERVSVVRSAAHNQNFEPAPSVVPVREERQNADAAPRERSRWLAFGAVCFAATLCGLLAGARVTEVSHRAPTAAIASEVNMLRVEQERTRVDLDRQARVLTATVLKVQAERDAAVAFRTRVESEQARMAAEVASLGDSSRKAQAHSDAKVYELGEAVKLIDWVASGGYALNAARSPGNPPSHK